MAIKVNSIIEYVFSQYADLRTIVEEKAREYKGDVYGIAFNKGYVNDHITVTIENPGSADSNYNWDVVEIEYDIVTGRYTVEVNGEDEAAIGLDLD